MVEQETLVSAVAMVTPDSFVDAVGLPATFSDPVMRSVYYRACVAATRLVEPPAMKFDRPALKEHALVRYLGQLVAKRDEFGRRAVKRAVSRG